MSFLDLFGVLLLLGFALLGFVLGAIRRGNALAGVEPAVLAILGGFLARTFIYLLLRLGDGSEGAALAIGWGFFLWPGAFDTVASIFDKQLLTAPPMLLSIATLVGAFTGMMNGIWRIHRWPVPGAFSFLLDVTWGLAGTTNAMLLHLWNFAWVRHGTEERQGAHRYEGGFAIKQNFAFTQGSVMSSNTHGPETGLYAHELTHVWQNRIFGPFYTLTYLTWMALWVIPALIVGAAKGTGPGECATQWCYFNCPWETWGYAVGQSHGEQPRTGWGSLIWSDAIVIAASIPFFAAIIGLSILIVSSAW